MELETNLIYCGDNLEVLAKFPEKSVDLIYADPPFFSKVKKLENALVVASIDNPSETVQ